MIFSDEPGYYEDGAFGIRLENLVRVIKAETEHNFGVRRRREAKSAVYVQ